MNWSRRRVLGAGLIALAARGGRLFAAEPQMSWLDNGTIRLGVDLTLGGAITWLSRSGSDVNVINSHDWGRQVQMSYYAGPVPFVVGEKRPKKYWEGLGWNPIQVGDARPRRGELHRRAAFYRRSCLARAFAWPRKVRRCW